MEKDRAEKYIGGTKDNYLSTTIHPILSSNNALVYKERYNINKVTNLSVLPSPDLYWLEFNQNPTLLRTTVCLLSNISFSSSSSSLHGSGFSPYRFQRVSNQRFHAWSATIFFTSRPVVQQLFRMSCFYHSFRVNLLILCISFIPSITENILRSFLISSFLRWWHPFTALNNFVWMACILQILLLRRVHDLKNVGTAMLLYNVTYIPLCIFFCNSLVIALHV